MRNLILILSLFLLSSPLLATPNSTQKSILALEVEEILKLKKVHPDIKSMNFYVKRELTKDFNQMIDFEKSKNKADININDLKKELESLILKETQNYDTRLLAMEIEAYINILEKEEIKDLKFFLKTPYGQNLSTALYQADIALEKVDNLILEQAKTQVQNHFKIKAIRKQQAEGALKDKNLLIIPTHQNHDQENHHLERVQNLLVIAGIHDYGKNQIAALWKDLSAQVKEFHTDTVKIEETKYYDRLYWLTLKDIRMNFITKKVTEKLTPQDVDKLVSFYQSEKGKRLAQKQTTLMGSLSRLRYKNLKTCYRNIYKKLILKYPNLELNPNYKIPIE